MRATRVRPGAKLVSIAHASDEYGLPQALLRDLMLRGEVAGVQPPHVRRLFLVRADLERKLQEWAVLR